MAEAFPQRAVTLTPRHLHVSRRTLPRNTYAAKKNLSNKKSRAGGVSVQIEVDKIALIRAGVDFLRGFTRFSSDLGA